MPKYFSNTLLVQRLNRIVKLDKGKVFLFSVDNKDVKNLIIEMNTIDQLYNKGIDSKGVDLKLIGGDYTVVTKDIKSYYNQPFDRITLKDSGEFYESFKVLVNKSQIIITADTMKDEDLTIRWGDDIIGLTDENMQRLIEILKQRYILYVRNLFFIN